MVGKSLNDVLCIASVLAIKGDSVTTPEVDNEQVGKENYKAVSSGCVLLSLGFRFSC